MAELNVSIAVVTCCHRTRPGWERVSRNEVGTVTDSAPFHVDDRSVPTEG